jgi:YD repeat-containing protein
MDNSHGQLSALTCQFGNTTSPTCDATGYRVSAADDQGNVVSYW